MTVTSWVLGGTLYLVMCIFVGSKVYQACDRGKMSEPDMQAVSWITGLLWPLTLLWHIVVTTFVKPWD